MPATAANAARNMRTLSANIRARLGLPDSPALWTYEQRATFLRQLSADVLRLPDSFTAEQVATARRIAGQTYEQLADTSFDLGAFAAEAGRNAAPALVETKWIVWGLVAFALLIALFRFGPRGQRSA
ncbi:MAG: hypothetical protein C0502_05070 [Opitutus sp.]|nr:hypothetical protein [Opitutus sp.]